MFIVFPSQIPIAPEDRWACGIAFESDGNTVTSQHITAPFGSVASVHAWERVGAALAHLGRNLLKIPVLRYVDDFFGPERHVHFCFLVSRMLCAAVYGLQARDSRERYELLCPSGKTAHGTECHLR